MWSAKYLFRLLCSSSAVRCKFGSLSASPVQRLEKTNGEEQDSPRKRGPMEKNKSRNTARYWGSMDTRHYLKCPIRRNLPWLSPLCHLIHLLQYTYYNTLPCTLSTPKALQETDLPAVCHGPPTNPFCLSFSLRFFTSWLNHKKSVPRYPLLLWLFYDLGKQVERSFLHILYFSRFEIRVV